MFNDKLVAVSNDNERHTNPLDRLAYTHNYKGFFTNAILPDV